MRPDPLTGTVIPCFTYDTPDAAEQDFYELCEGPLPLVLVFLSNFGHPISREYLMRYVRTLPALQSGRLACVVRSQPQRIAEGLGGGTFPFPLICDAEGVLYEHFGIRSSASRLRWTFEAQRIFRRAQEQGYVLQKSEPQLLPLTLAVGPGGQILFAHHGQSLTDLPEDCAALEQVCRHLPRPAAEAPDAAEEPTAAEEPDASAFDVPLAGEEPAAARPAPSGAPETADTV